MSLKQAAEDLLKVAEAMEKQAAEVSNFVCDKCNHTSTLAHINAARKKMASEVGENVTVSDITVNDKIHCPVPTCEGVMAYVENEASAGLYYDPEKVAAKDPDAPHDESKETPAAEKAESKDTQKDEKEEGTEQHDQPKAASIDYDAIDRYIKG
jgi:hypothetical protein